MSKVFLIIAAMAILFACAAKQPFMHSAKMVRDTVLVAVPDTVWLDQNRMVVYRVVADTITRKIDTSYTHSYDEPDRSPLRFYYQADSIISRPLWSAPGINY